MSDRERLAEHVDVWWEAVGDFTDLLSGLEPDDWARPTDLPGWDVKACAAHTAHLESVLAGGPEETADLGDPPPPHVTSVMGHYTEIGVVNRRDADPAAIVEEIRAATSKRHERLLAEPPSDPSGTPWATPGGVPWNWGLLLSNRIVDVWMHEQDVRRAVGRPGGMESRAATHTAITFARGFGKVLAKNAGAPAGTLAVLAVDGQPARAFTVTDEGRGQALPDVPQDVDVTLRMDRASYIVLAGGRVHDPEAGAVDVEGDAELGRRLLGSFAVTP